MQEVRSGSQEAPSALGTVGTGKKDPPGRELREGRSGKEEVVMRVVTSCEEGAGTEVLKKSARAEVTAQVSERSLTWSSNFKL